MEPKLVRFQDFADGIPLKGKSAWRATECLKVILHQGGWDHRIARLGSEIQKGQVKGLTIKLENAKATRTSNQAKDPADHMPRCKCDLCLARRELMSAKADLEAFADDPASTRDKFSEIARTAVRWLEAEGYVKVTAGPGGIVCVKPLRGMRLVGRKFRFVNELAEHWEATLLALKQRHREAAKAKTRNRRSKRTRNSSSPNAPAISGVSDCDPPCPSTAIPGVGDSDLPSDYIKEDLAYDHLDDLADDPNFSFGKSLDTATASASSGRGAASVSPLVNPDLGPGEVGPAGSPRVELGGLPRVEAEPDTSGSIVLEACRQSNENTPTIRSGPNCSTAPPGQSNVPQNRFSDLSEARGICASGPQRSDQSRVPVEVDGVIQHLDPAGACRLCGTGGCDGHPTSVWRMECADLTEELDMWGTTERIDCPGWVVRDRGGALVLVTRRRPQPLGGWQGMSLAHGRFGRQTVISPAASKLFNLRHATNALDHEALRSLVALSEAVSASLRPREASLADAARTVWNDITTGEDAPDRFLDRLWFAARDRSIDFQEAGRFLAALRTVEGYDQLDLDVRDDDALYLALEDVQNVADFVFVDAFRRWCVDQKRATWGILADRLEVEAAHLEKLYTPAWIGLSNDGDGVDHERQVEQRREDDGEPPPDLQEVRRWWGGISDQGHVPFVLERSEVAYYRALDEAGELAPEVLLQLWRDDQAALKSQAKLELQARVEEQAEARGEAMQPGVSWRRRDLCLGALHATSRPGGREVLVGHGRRGRDRS